MLKPLIIHVFIAALAAAPLVSQPADSPMSTTKTESVDRDPEWDGYNNRIVPKQFRTIAQNFGFSKSNFAGEAPGELGGRIWRAAQPAFYADKIEPKTLNDRLTASGRFAL